MGNRYQPPYRGAPYQPPPPPPPGGDPFGPGDRKDLIAGVMMPKTVVQLAIWVFMFGLGAGLAGLLLFILYQTQINNLEGRIIDSREELEKKLNQRIEELEQRPAPEPNATLNVAAALAERTRNEQLRSVAPAIVGIQGLDASGKPTSGSGFIVNTTGEGSWVVTSYELVAGSRPETGVTVKIGPSEIIGQLYESDPGADLALVIVNVSGKKALRFTRGELKPGDPVWVMGTARNSPYATIVDAHLVDYSPARVVVDVDPAAQFNGGPVIDAQGRVVGVLSSRVPRTSAVRPSPDASASPGASPSPVTATRGATPIKNACNVILRCPGSRPSGSPAPDGSPTPAASPSPRPQPSPEAPPAPPAPPPAAACRSGEPLLPEPASGLVSGLVHNNPRHLQPTLRQTPLPEAPNGSAGPKTVF